MDIATLESLGITKEEIKERVINTIVNRFLTDNFISHGEEFDFDSKWATDVQDKIKAKIDESIENIAAKNVIPHVGTYIENMCLQETNKWGEKTGISMTFIEYLVSRAEKYLTEPVDVEGKSRSEKSSYGIWKSKTTRINYLIDRHLQYSIENALRNAIKIVNDTIPQGLADTVKMQMEEIIGRLKISTK